MFPLVSPARGLKKNPHTEQEEEVEEEVEPR